MLETCSFIGCPRAVSRRDLCRAHIAQLERGQDLHPTLDMLPRHCRHEGCNRPIFILRRQVCHYHYALEKDGPKPPPTPRDCLNCGREFSAQAARSTAGSVALPIAAPKTHA